MCQHVNVKHRDVIFFNLDEKALSCVPHAVGADVVSSVKVLQWFTDRWQH